MNKTKPIFIIKIPAKGLSDKQTDELINSIHARTNRILKNDYHVLTVQNFEENKKFKFECFNSPYNKEEFEKLEDLINKLNKEKL